jgi:DNA polymerase III subunit epsilon
MDARLRTAIVLGACALVLWLLASWALWVASMSVADREAVLALLQGSWGWLLLMAVVGAGLMGLAMHRAFGHWVQPMARLAEQAEVLLGTESPPPLAVQGPREVQALADRLNRLVQARAQLQQRMDERVQEASRGVEQERNRLAALMSELSQSVVVCNLDGRILLYNASARAQFRTLSQAPQLADGAELIGLGRSIYAVFDRQLVAHALESVQQRLQRGQAQPTAQFVTTTPAGQLLRVQMAPVRQVQEAAEGGQATQSLAGFVLMLENITRDFEDEAGRDRLLLGLTEGTRSSLASIQAALEMLEFPDLEPAMRERFLGVVREEVGSMRDRLRDLTANTSEEVRTRWPMEDMLGSDFVTAACVRIEQLAALPASPAEVDATLWLRIESFSMLQVLTYLTARLAEEFEVRFVQLRLQPAPGGQRAQLDLVWIGQAMSTETVMGWEMDPMKAGGRASPSSVRDVVERHGGAFWFERERSRHQAFFRFLLPLANPQEPLAEARVLHSGSRPEYYDFDLFRSSEASRALEDRPLVDLAYTVFDTETTGLNPSQGDEIIQIGATRIVNGKLLRQESFEQLVDPECMIPPVSIPIHGITQDMVRGQPTIATVLPAFHAFSQDTVLVAHNAAFDMRFLELKEASTGVRFEQPVLDTLLLSAVAQPNQESHRLEAIAERLGVTILGRHTALGDAIVTAEVFLRLVPLLAERGIHTLGQARAASQQTFYARVKY